MTLVYRSVKGSALTAAEFDGNTHDLDDRITAIEDAPAADIFSDPAFEVIGDQFYVNLAGSTDPEGPFDFPTVYWSPKGQWTAATTYLKYDTVYYGTTLYLVLINHISEATFDPAANNGMGDDYYGVVFTMPTVTSSTIDTSDDEISTILAHANSYVRCASATGTTITVLSDDSANHAINTEIEYRLGVSGATMTFVPEVEGTTDDDAVPVINYPDEDFLLSASKKGAVVGLKKVAANEWDCFGLLDAI